MEVLVAMCREVQRKDKEEEEEGVVNLDGPTRKKVKVDSDIVTVKEVNL